MEISTLFNVGSLHYKIIDGSIREFEVFEINITAVDKNPKIDYCGGIRGSEITTSATFNEGILKNSWFRSPEEAANNLVNSFYNNRSKKFKKNENSV